MRRSITLVILFTLLLPLSSVWSQSDVFTGRLLDSKTNEPIANSKIIIEKQENVTYSNALGYFQVSGIYKKITISHIGYETVKFELKPETTNFSIKISSERYLLQSLKLNNLASASDYNAKAFSELNKIAKVSRIQSATEQMASFPEGLEAFHDYLKDELYKKKNLIDRPFEYNILFTIDKNGALEVDSIKGDREFSSIITSIFEDSPKWIPASQNGLPVPLSFNQELTYNAAKTVEQQAEPVGGMMAFYKQIGPSLAGKYPRQAQKSGIEGIVYVKVVIEKDGSITDVEAVEGIGGGCDEVAVNAVTNNIKWQPATIDGKPVRSTRILPISFKLN